MIVVTTETVSGRKTVRTLGLVRGNTIRCRHLGRDILAGLKNLVGGEVMEYTKMMAEAREQAVDRMIADAERRQRRGRRPLLHGQHDAGRR